MTSHGSEQARRIAEEGEILRVEVGSSAHGTAIDGQDDLDLMGICIEPPEYVIGLQRFEQYIFRTQPEGHRSGPGDIDLVVYSLRKWMRLAVQGNPTVLIPLFVDEHLVKHSTELGRELRANADMASREAGQRFLGYMRVQRQKADRGTGTAHEPSGADRAVRV